jgi:hypothetical protein
MKTFIRRKNELSFFGTIIFVVALCLAKMELVQIISTLIIYGIFTFPGYLLLRRCGLSTMHAMIYGVPCGFAITGLFLLIHLGSIGWNFYLIAFFYLLIVLGLFLGIRKSKERETNHTDTQSLQISFTLLLVICLFVFVAFIPFYYMGVLTEHGYAYSGLFGHDFILRGTYSVALANSVPPDNYFFYGKQIQNFYLLGYILPAAVYRIIGFDGNIREILSVICLLNIPVFFLLVYDLIFDFIGYHKKINIQKVEKVFSVVMFCYSYHWIFFFLKRFADSKNVGFLKTFTDKMGLISQSWLRNVIFEPQLVLALMMVILILKIMRRPYTVQRGFWLGVFFSAMAMSDIAIFFIFSTSYGLFLFYEFIKNRKLAIVCDSFALAIAGIAMVIIFFLLGILTSPEYSNQIILRPYTVVIIGLPVFLLLHLGFLPVTTITGILGRPRDRESILMIILLVVCLFFMFFVWETINGNTFIRKGLYLLRLPVLLFSVYYLYQMTKPRWSKIVYTLLLIALPTIISDVYALADVDNKTYTTYVSENEMQAAAWLKNNTERDVVVQSAIDYPGYFDYSLTVSFAERRGGLSHWKLAYVFYPNINALQERSTKIRKIFSTDSAMERYQIVKNLQINYLLVGNEEQKQYPGCQLKIGNDIVHFYKVYSNKSVKIYKVL